MNMPTTEHNEQAALVSTVRITYQHRKDFLPALFFATMSGAWIGGSSRGGKAALINKYKSEGWVNGVADLLYLQPRGPYAFLAIEMKTPTRRGEKFGGASEDQIEWLQSAKRAGALAVICYGAEHAWDVFSDYMAMEER